MKSALLCVEKKAARFNNPSNKPRGRRGRVNHQKLNTVKLINHISPLLKQATHSRAWSPAVAREKVVCLKNLLAAASAHHFISQKCSILLVKTRARTLSNEAKKKQMNKNYQ